MNARVTPRLRRLRHERGQSMVEFAMVLPFLLVIVLGVVEVGYALLDQHVVTKLAREGANLISRDATLQEAETALRSMSGRPINFADGSKVIFSVLKQVPHRGGVHGQMIHGATSWEPRLVQVLTRLRRPLYEAPTDNNTACG
jgi:hypothetical protein